MNFNKITLSIMLTALLVAVLPPEKARAASVFIPEMRSPIITFSSENNPVPASGSYVFDLSAFPELSDNLEYQVVIGYYFENGGKSIPYAVPVETAGIRRVMPVTSTTICLPWNIPYERSSPDPCSNRSWDGRDPEDHWFYVSSTYKNKQLTINYTWNTNHWAPGKEWTNFFFVFGEKSYNYTAPPTLTFTPDSTNLSYGDATMLRWSSANTVSPCVASGDWSGTKPTTGADGTGPLTSNKSYTLTCLAQDGTSAPAIKTVNINVAAPLPSADIKAGGSDGPISISYAQSATISWASVYSQFPQYSGSCSVSKDGTSFASGTSGSQPTGLLQSSQTYSISCTGALGPASDSVIVNVAAPTLSVALSANPVPQSNTHTNFTTTLITNVGGTAIGTINYSLWWNCNNTATNVATASGVCGALPATTAGNCAENNNGVKCEALNSTSLSRPHTYSCPVGGGTCSFVPKVISERMNLAVTNAVGLSTAGPTTPGVGGAGGGTGGGTSGGTGGEGGAIIIGAGAGGVLITIQEPPRYFTLSKSGNLEAGVSTNPVADSNKIQITINPFNLFAADTRLETVDMPAGAAAHFGTSGASTATLNAPYPKSVDFWVTIPRSTATGTHTIRMRGTGGGVSDTIEIPLNVIQRQPKFREI